MLYFSQRTQCQRDITIQQEAYLTLKFVTTNSPPVNMILNWKENDKIFINLFISVLSKPVCKFKLSSKF